MTHVTSGELQKNFGLYRTVAMKEPITITNHGREDLVMLSIDEYKRLLKFEQRTFHASKMTTDELVVLDAATIPEKSAQFNDEVS